MKMTERNVQYQIKAGLLKATKYGGVYLVLPAEYDRWKEARRTKSGVSKKIVK